MATAGAVCALAVSLAACGAAGTGEPKPEPQASTGGHRPNFVFVMTDDQEAGSLAVMPKLQQNLVKRGMTFDNAFVSYPLCCPARASFQTGQYAHNHGVLNNRPPDGGYPAFDPSETLPVWLQRSGYETAYIGKYMNDYTKHDDIPPGWDRWFGLVEPSSRYFKAHVNDQGTFTKFGKHKPADYSTDLFTNRAVDFIHNRDDPDAPFYLSVGYVAPHVAKSFLEQGHCSDKGPQPAPRHLGAFQKRQIPRGPSFNEEDVTDKPAAVRDRPKLEGDELSKKTDKYQCRLETLLAVDDGVGRIVKALRAEGQLNDTYVVFVSDNGFIQGEHRIDGGKAVPYENSIRIPMVVRGPGVPKGSTSTEIASNVDYAPTVLDLAGAEPGLAEDGRSFAPTLHDSKTRDGRALLIESNKEPEPFRGVRTGRYLYVERASGESEMYDLRDDPDELENIGENPVYVRARDSLRSLLTRLRDCRGPGCSTQPDLSLEVGNAPGKRACPTKNALVSLAGPDAQNVVSTKVGTEEGLERGERGAVPYRVKTRGDQTIVADIELVDGRQARVTAPVPSCD